MPSLSISCVETRDLDKAARAVERTAQCIKADCLYWFSTHPYPGAFPGKDVVNVLVRQFTDFFEDIGHICLRLMPLVVTTEFNLIVQSDGFAVNGSAWDDRFWNYDYIGAPWTWMWGGGPPWSGPIVGNGGFSLRSRRLYAALLDLDVKWNLRDWLLDERLDRREYYATNYQGGKFLSEDLIISLWYRDILEARYGIKFCPPELANKFSVETLSPFTQPWLGRSFGFHGIMAASHYGVTLTS
jgi:hypothetical protein